MRFELICPYCAEFIQKLIMKEKQLQAIKFIYEFELLHVFPPVELIKAHLRCTRKAIKKIRKRVRKVSTEGQVCMPLVSDSMCLF